MSLSFVFFLVPLAPEGPGGVSGRPLSLVNLGFGAGSGPDRGVRVTFILACVLGVCHSWVVGRSPCGMWDRSEALGDQRLWATEVLTRVMEMFSQGPGRSQKSWISGGRGGPGRPANPPKNVRAESGSNRAGPGRPANPPTNVRPTRPV